MHAPRLPRVEYGDEELRRLACVPGSESQRWGREIVRAYRKRIQSLRAATSESDLFALRSLDVRWLAGDRAGCFSIRVDHGVVLIASPQAGDASGRTVTLHELTVIAEGSRHVR